MFQLSFWSHEILPDSLKVGTVFSNFILISNLFTRIIYDIVIDWYGVLKRIFEYLKLGTFASCISENKSAVLFLLLPLDSNGVRLCIFLIYKLKAHNTLVKWKGTLLFTRKCWGWLYQKSSKQLIISLYIAMHLRGWNSETSILLSRIWQGIMAWTL